MDLPKALREAWAGMNETEVRVYISTVLELYVKGELLHESTIDRLMALYMLINTGDREGVRRMLRELNNGGNWPSTTGNPSGSGRGNA